MDRIIKKINYPLYILRSKAFIIPKSKGFMLFLPRSCIMVRQEVAFIVDADYRRKGIGEKLMNEAEKWAIGQEVTYIMLNSGNREERKIAHRFYLNMGYKDKSTGFSKPLDKQIIKNEKDLKL
jgi:GNAT superfamily N-acetyltransferase